MDQLQECIAYMVLELLTMNKSANIVQVFLGLGAARKEAPQLLRHAV